MLSRVAKLSTNIWCKLGQCSVKTHSNFAASLSCTISLHTHCVKAIISNSILLLFLSPLDDNNLFMHPCGSRSAED